MKVKNFLQRRLLCVLVIVTLLVPVFSGLPRIQSQAASRQANVENPDFTFTTTEGTTVSTKANSGETTVLIFGYVGCGLTRSTLNSIASCNWVKRSDIRVIFAETKGHTQEEVQSYKDGYQCPEMIFCYDEMFDIQGAMGQYVQILGVTSGKYPFTVLIDENNKIQNILTGAKTADDILNEIKQFADIDEEGGQEPPSTDPDAGFENFAYGLKTIDNTDISTRANPNETTVLVFGYTTCGLTKATLTGIDQSAWAGRSDIRVIYVETQGGSLTDTKEFAQNFPHQNIIFCHDESMLNFSYALTYLRLYNYTGGTYPYIVFIDKNNKVRNLTLGPKTADEILEEINKFAGNQGSETDPDTKPGTDPDTKPGTDPDTKPGTGTNQNTGTKPGAAVSVSNVSGLKASSTAKSVKLTWKKVSNAKGYLVYQYNNAKKKWVEKAVLNSNTPSYTIKKLTAGTAYRFAVKAFVQPKNGAKVSSKSYTALYTATAPNAVNFKVTPGKKKASIKWSKVKGATGYTVYYKAKAKDSWKKLKATKGLKYTKSRLKSGSSYIFTVKAYKTYKGNTYTSSFRSKKVKIM